MQNCSRCEEFLCDVCYYGHSLSLLRGYCDAGSVFLNSPSSAIFVIGLIAPVTDHETNYAESAHGGEEPPVVVPSGSCGFVDEIAMGPAYEGRSRQSPDSAGQQGKEGLALGADSPLDSSCEEDLPGLEEIGPADPVQGYAEQYAGEGIIRCPQGIEQVAQGSASQGEDENGLDSPIPEKPCHHQHGGHLGQLPDRHDGCDLFATQEPQLLRRVHEVGRQGNGKKEGGSKKHRRVPLLEQPKSPEAQDVQDILWGTAFGRAVGQQKATDCGEETGPDRKPPHGCRQIHGKQADHPSSDHPSQASPNPDFSEIAFRVICAAQGDGG